MKVIAVVQARMGSTRLRGKSLMQLSKFNLLNTVINSAKRNDFIDDVIIVTSELKEDDVLFNYCMINKIACYRGSGPDVLSRFINVAKNYNHDDVIVRVTADNPFNNSDATVKLFKKHLEENNDYTHVENLSHVVYEFVKVGALLKLESVDNLDESDREHVTFYFRKNKQMFKTAFLKADVLGLNPSLDKLLTIDNQSDYNRILKMKDTIDIDTAINFEEVYSLLEKNE